MLAFLAEASPTIGTGHVVETAALVREAAARGLAATVWVNEEAPPALLVKVPADIRRVPALDAEGVGRIAAEARAAGARAVVTNLRAISNAQVLALADGAGRVVCLDEWGNRELDCDVVVNPAPVPAQHRYTSRHPRFRLYTGPGYLPLAREYRDLHDQGRAHQGPLRAIAVAMGGMDRTGIVIRLVEALLAVRPDLEIHAVLGAGFARHRELEPLRASPSLRVHQSLPTLADLLRRCDAGFTVGGNTLLEMACVGTPALVLYEEPHECAQSQAIEALGFGRCLGPATGVDRDVVTAALGALDDPGQRARQATVGRALVDGQGATRILDIVASA